MVADVSVGKTSFLITYKTDEFPGNYGPKIFNMSTREVQIAEENLLSSALDLGTFLVSKRASLNKVHEQVAICFFPDRGPADKTAPTPSGILHCRGRSFVRG